MPEQARRHHVVSKFYLRYFANDNARVTTVMLPGDRTFPQSIGDASVQTGFYTVIDQDGQQSDAAEQALSLVEAHAATAWREVAAGVWPLPDEHRGRPVMTDEMPRVQHLGGRPARDQPPGGGERLSGPVLRHVALKRAPVDGDGGDFARTRRLGPARFERRKLRP